MGKAPVKKILAVRKFTDRNEPRNAFNRIFTDAQQHTDEFNVISFYGIGGFGKTRLINELAKGIDKYNDDHPDQNNIPHVTYDFSRGTNKMYVIEKMKHLLKQEGLSFPYSDALEAAYNIKCGNPVYKTVEEKELLDNPMLSAVADFIPGGSSILSTIKAGKAFLEESGKYYKKIEKLWNVSKKQLDEEIKTIGKMEINELEEKVSYYFAQDLYNNTNNISDEYRLPVVIFLDTYEELVNSYRATDYANAYDVWLREDIIKTTPGILWVIGGREKLNWEENDDFWEGAIEEHELGDLTKEDAFDFLSTAGIPDNLLEDIYAISGGTPLFLDLNVTTYYQLLSSGKPITKEAFGTSKEQVIERFLRYMNPDDQNIAKLLAVLENWSDEEATIIGKAVLPVFYPANYESFIEHTIIIKDNESRYYMHRQVRKVIFEAARENNPLLVKNIYLHKLQYLNNLDWDNMEISEYLDNLEKALNILVSADFRPSVFEDAFRLYSQRLNRVYNMALYRQFYHLSSIVLKAAHYGGNSAILIWHAYGLACEKLKMYGEGLKYTDLALREMEKINDRSVERLITVKNIKALCLKGLGLNDESFEIHKQLYELARKTFGPDHIMTLGVYNNIGSFYSDKNDHQNAYDIFKQIYDSFCRQHKEDDDLALTSLTNMALNLGRLGNRKEATRLYQKAYDSYLRIYGSKNLITLKTMNTLALNYQLCNETDKAIELYEKELADCKDIYEDEDYDFLGTMISAYEQKGDFYNAYKTHQKFIEIYIRRFGVNDKKVMNMGARSVMALRHLSKDEQIAIEKEAYFESVDKDGMESEGAYRHAFNIAFNYMSDGRMKEAIPWYLKAYDIAMHLYGPDDEKTFGPLSNLGACYFWINDFESALSYHRQHYNACLANKVEDYNSTITALINICSCLTFMGNYEEAYAYQKQLLKAENTPENTVRYQFDLAYTCLQLNRKAETFELLQKVHDSSFVLTDKTDFRKDNTYEKMALKYRNPDLINDRELQMLKDISDFVNDYSTDDSLKHFYSEAFIQRKELIETL